MKKTELLIKEHSELFKKFYAERLSKWKEYKQKHNIKETDSINSIDHPDYFKIDEEWDKRRKIIENDNLTIKQN